MEPLLLAGEFETPDHEQWMAAVERVLKGRDFDRVLRRATADGIAIEPLYGPGQPTERKSPTPVSRTHGRWDIRAAVPLRDPSAASIAVLSELENGSTSLELHGETDELSTVLAEVLLDLAPVSLRAGSRAVAMSNRLADVIGARGVEAAGGSLGIDPYGTLAAAGSWNEEIGATHDAVAALARRPELEPLSLITASGCVVAEAGGSEAQEIAFLLASAVANLQGLVERGLPVAEAAGRIELDITADVDVFVTIAKLRALRRCWATVLEASGAADATVAVTARSNWAALTAVDPWVNLLRGTAATFAAVIGGADSVVLAPFDSVSLDGDVEAGYLGRRLARNTQLLLQDESNLGFVTDPAGGSWFLESLTDQLAEQAWSIFQQFEQAGGAFAILDSGLLVEKVGEVAAQRRSEIARRAQPITGVSEFPLLDERRPEYGPFVEFPVSSDPALSVTPLERHRRSAAFERLRAAAEAAASQPTIWMEQLGTPASNAARTSFATNALAAGGFAITTEGDFASSGLRAAVICGSDSDYAADEGGAAGAAARLKQQGATLVLLAGRAGSDADQLRAAGVDEFLGLGTDLLALLVNLHDHLGIS